MAAEYSEELSEWLPGATEARLVARHEGRGVASVNAFIDAAKGRTKTLTFVETDNGGSICGGYLDVAWVDGGYVSDRRRNSFVFALKNHLGVPPMKFAQTRDDMAAHVSRGYDVSFGYREGFVVSQFDYGLYGGRTYEAPAEASLFDGDDGRIFRARRWELWEVT
jgi:hypothetical protein